MREKKGIYMRSALLREEWPGLEWHRREMPQDVRMWLLVSNNAGLAGEGKTG